MYANCTQLPEFRQSDLSKLCNFLQWRLAQGQIDLAEDAIDTIRNLGLYDSEYRYYRETLAASAERAKKKSE